MTRRLAAWFLLVIFFTIGSMGWIVNSTTGELFRSFRGSHTDGHLAELPAVLSIYHASNDGWQGVADELDRFASILSMQLVLIDSDAAVLASTRGDTAGATQNDVEWVEEALPISDSGSGDVLATLLIAPDLELRQADSSFFDELLRGSVLTMLLVGTLAAAAAVLVARSFAAPLKRMGEASNQVMLGHYDVRVDEHDRDEIGALGKAFNQMAQEIGKLERVRRDLVINVSHDLRTPLTVVQGYLEALQSGKIADRRSAEKAFDSMAVEIGQLQSLIDGLNEVAALDAGRIPINKDEVDIGQLVAGVVERARWSAADKGVTIELTVPDPSPVAEVDETKMAQVLFNLIDNAIHYTDGGGAIGVTVAGGGQPGEPNSEDLTIVVTDNGEGISADDLPFIFERFYRTASSRNRQVDGYGMGLSIARSVVRAHGGEVEATSSGVYGEGCAFTVSIPAPVSDLDQGPAVVGEESGADL